jgi:glucose-1-phosphate thymidylyltransferase
MLGGLRSSITGIVDDASDLSGPVVVGDGARVTRSRIEGPVVVGAGALIEDSFIGPGTSIGRDCVLRDAAVAGSIVLDGASITDVLDLRDCLIGRSALVGAAHQQQRHHQLVVGDDVTIQLATRRLRSPLEVVG